MTPQPFSRTLRSLRRDGSAWTPLALLGVTGLLAAWFTWFVTADVPVFATTEEARLEVGGRAHSMAAPIDGVLAKVNAVLGQAVEAGEVLVELHADIERAQLQEAEARQRSASSRLESRLGAKRELAAALEKAAEAANLGVREARVRARAGETAAEAARVEAERAAELGAHGLISDQELERARAEADRKRAEAQELALAEDRARAEWELEYRDRRSALEALDHEIVELRGLVESTAAAAERDREAVRRRTVRAPVSGIVAEVARLGPGAVVEAGQPLVTVIPEDRVRAVAHFAPAEAIGRIEVRQPAEIRLAGFPWTEFGVLEAEVRSVAGELREGKVVVVLDLASQEGGRIPLRHGLPGTVAVRVEEVSPAGLLFRSLGRSLSDRRVGPDR